MQNPSAPGRLLSLSALFLATFCRLPAADVTDDRIMLDATVNGRPVHLAFDTGADRILLFSSPAERLGLKIIPPKPGTVGGPGEVLYSHTEPLSFRIGSGMPDDSVQLFVFDEPSGDREDIDGVVGWKALAGNDVLNFDAERLHLAIQTELPAATATWQKLAVRKNSPWMVWEIPATGRGGGTAGVQVDTGSPGDVQLSPARLREWRMAHPNARSTIDANYYPTFGMVVREVFWADELTVGPLTFRGVTVEESPAFEIAMTEGYAATLGLHALEHLNWVVDVKNDTVYFEPVKTPVTPPQHNRLGAVFAPRDVKTSGTLEAHVIVGTPGYEAGIRDGDVLLKIDALDTTKWRTDPKVLPLARFWERPAGTKMNLVLRRDGKDLSFVVTLRDLLVPAATVKPPPAKHP